MIRIDKHIRDLLQENECVIVPKMGGILNTSPLKGPYKLSSGPGSLRLSFNTLLNYNDGLLANHIAKHEKITYKEALEEIEKFVDEFQNELHSGNKFTIEHVGVLYADAGTIRIEPIGNLINSKDEGNTESDSEFVPDNGINQVLNNLQFSISSVPVILEQRKSVVSRRKRFISLFLILTGSMLLLCLFIYYSRSGENSPALISKIFNITERLANKEDKSTATELAPGVTPGIENGVSSVSAESNNSDLSNHSSVSNEPAVNSSAHKYYIVVGSFHSLENSIKKREEMRSKGFKSTQIISVKGHPHLVSIRHFTSIEEAQQTMNQLMAQYKEAWIYIK